ncbi:MAG: 4Fe-4S binding protein [Thermoprotei archaeon]|nr:4Fe-4S binding protein [Thermoprotei archaeon]
MRLRVKPGRCVRRWFKGSNCNLCETSCPAGAVSVKGRDVEVKEDLCVLCGACASVCPVSVFDLGVDDLIYSLPEGESIKVTCRASGGGYLSLCINSLNLNHYIILASKFKDVVVDGRCDGCKIKGVGLVEALKAESLLAGRVKVLKGSAEEPPRLVVRETLRSMIARGLLVGLSFSAPAIAWSLEKVAGRVIVEDLGRPERGSSTLKVKAWEAASKLGLKVNTVYPEVDYDKCIFCGVCSGVCPVGAIYYNPAGILKIDTRACVSCNICVNMCPEKAMTMSEGASGPILEYVKSMVECPKCGFTYPATLKECPQCSVIDEIVRDVYKGSSKECKEYAKRIIDKLRDNV